MNKLILNNLTKDIFKNGKTFLSTYKIITVKSPLYPESILEGDIKLFKKKGDFCTAGEKIANLKLSAIVSVNVTCPNDGLIEEFLVEDGTAIKSETNLLKLKCVSN